MSVVHVEDIFIKKKRAMKNFQLDRCTEIRFHVSRLQCAETSFVLPWMFSDAGKKRSTWSMCNRCTIILNRMKYKGCHITLSGLADAGRRVSLLFDLYAYKASVRDLCQVSGY